MPKEDTIKIEGKVEELLPNMTFRVSLENGMTVLAHLCGKMRMRNIRVFVGGYSQGGNVTLRPFKSKNYLSSKII